MSKKRKSCVKLLAVAAVLSSFGLGWANAVDTPAARAKACGAPQVWDFVGGTPAGGSLRKGACVSADGLVAVDPTNLFTAAGFALDRLWTPSGAFLFEAEFIPADASGSEMMLWDDLAVTQGPKLPNRGFQLSFNVRHTLWTPKFTGGFSNETVGVQGPTVTLKPNVPAKIAFYFGADGRVLWDFAGNRMEAKLRRVGPLAASSRYRPVIGDRACGNYHPFRGAVKRVSITPCALAPIGILLDGRAAFLRGEDGAKVEVKVANATTSDLSGIRIRAEQFAGSGCLRQETHEHEGALAAGTETRFKVPVETRVRSGWNVLRVTATGKDATGAAVEAVRTFRVGIGPRTGDRMTALMWGFRAPASALSEFGFTHGLNYTMPGAPDEMGTYDEALVSGIRMMHLMSTVYPGGKPDERYMRKNRDGSFPVKNGRPVRSPEVSNPAFLETMKPLIAKDVEMYGAHPGFAGVLAISEARDASFPSYNTEHLRYKAETGRDVPPGIERKVLHHIDGLAESKRRFPDGVVPEDDPVLAYYRWFWKKGDGWPAYSGGIAQEYHRRVSRPDFLVFWDPSVRCPPIWGSGGAVDMLDTWVYATPEPMNVAGPAEEILAMCAGRPGQQPSIMTQLICYRSWTAPKGRKVEPEPEWVKRFPLAEFTTIPPDALQEAVWSMIAKPMQAVMFHGWATIYDTGDVKYKCLTSPEGADRLRHLLKNVVAPLGPTLKRLGRETPPVAVLESFTTCALGGPASWGWSAPYITFAQRARLDPRVVYEDTILRDGLGDVKVLYAPQCLFLTPSVVAKIREFQARGGVLVADTQLVKALRADVVVPVVSFSPPPESDDTEGVDAVEVAREGDTKTRLATSRAKARMLAQANELRKNLAARFVPAADSSSPEIVVYGRQWKETRYVVAVNDHRTFGDYFGPWGLMMEKGLPYEGEVSVVDDEAVKAVYEISRGGEVPFTRADGRLKVRAKYDTNDGRIFAFLKQKIAALKVDAPKTVRRGESVRVTVSALDALGRPVDALLPAEVRLFATDGKELDGAGWVCLEGGVCTVDILTNIDDAPGGYRLVCRDRASGRTAVTTIEEK